MYSDKTVDFLDSTFRLAVAVQGAAVLGYKMCECSEHSYQYGF